MADQDFAQIEAVQPEEVRPTSQSKIFFLTLLALGVVAGGFALGFMVGQQTGMEKASSEDEARLIIQLKKQQQELAILRAQVKKNLPDVSTTQVGELTFYNELPRQSVEPEPLTTDPRIEKPSPERAAEVKEMKPADETSSEMLLKDILTEELNRQGSEKVSAQHLTSTPVKTAVSTGEYYLQLASFQKESAAKNFFPKLRDVGYEGVIRRVELPGLGVWYRVYAGAFVSKQLAEDAKKEVKSRLNITGLIVKDILKKSP